MFSAYREAMLDDPDVAERLATAAESTQPGHPALSEFTPEIALLTVIGDRLGEVISGLVALGNNKPPRVAPLPRPVTGVERARARLSEERHRSLVSEVEAAQERWRQARNPSSTPPLEDQS